MSKLTLLHTSDLHPPNFNRLGDDLSVDLRASHVVAEDLLERSRAAGTVTDAVYADLRKALETQQEAGVDAVLCTCSTIGDAAEEIGREIGLPTLRIDRALAEAAFEAGPKLLVAACLRSTLDPTEGLFRAIATEKGIVPDITMLLIESAWPFFEKGDIAGFAAEIAASVKIALAGHDAIALAQASMACAEPLLMGLGVPVLSSPLLGLKRGLALAQAAAREKTKP